MFPTLPQQFAIICVPFLRTVGAGTERPCTDRAWAAGIRCPASQAGQQYGHHVLETTCHPVGSCGFPLPYCCSIPQMAHPLANIVEVNSTPQPLPPPPSHVLKSPAALHLNPRVFPLCVWFCRRTQSGHAHVSASAVTQTSALPICTWTGSLWHVICCVSCAHPLL